MLELAPAGSRYLGGERFHANPTGDDESRVKMGKEWKAFGGHRFVLPQVELIRSSAETEAKAGAEAEGEQGDGMGREAEAEDMGQGRGSGAMSTTLAVNMVWRGRDSTNEDDELLTWESALEAATSVLASAVYDGTSLRASPPAVLPAVLERTEGCRKEWASAVERALEEIEEERAYDKVVLARSVQVSLAEDLSGAGAGAGAGAGSGGPFELMAAMRHDHGYLFALDLGTGEEGMGGVESGGAFFGCTPEKLFDSDMRGHVRTMAVAGTRPRGSDSEEDQRLGRDLMSSPKDMSENRIVAEFLQVRQA